MDVLPPLQHAPSLPTPPSHAFGVHNMKTWFIHRTTRMAGLINYLNVVYLRYCLNVWDVGGQKTIMSYWRKFFEQTNGLVWFADSSHIRRLDDCRAELHNLLKEERLVGASLLIFANKQDMQGALKPTGIAKFNVGAKGYAKLNVVSSVMLYYGCSEASNFSVVTLRQLIAAWFSRRYTRFKKRSADFHGRAADLVHSLRGTAMPRRQALEEEQCREEKGISTVPKHKYASKACSPKDDAPLNYLPQKRLILTSQLIQQLLPAIPATILRGQAVSTYGSATYTLSMLTLRDACSMVASLSSSYNSCSPVEDENNPSEQTSAKKMEDRVSKVVEVFAGRIQKMENDFISDSLTVVSFTKEGCEATLLSSNKAKVV
ncbi:hypothetical protein ZEAMMB73_Zm00001d053092 [Zea mays]|uniref:ADP-ribosylation factor n=1 Tax=Zea mays TaxID=4577 RepID=A0A1D6QM39_MAIZE|nr:hypothetical protein ZEAMMB73_Zm00001d053092 [Zea mays]